MLQTLLKKSALGPPDSSDDHVSCTAPATENASLQIMILFKCPTPAIVFGNATKTLTFCSLLTRCTIPCACHAKRRFNGPKVARTCGVLSILASKCASHHDGVHFVEHLDYQKCSEPFIFLHFWLRNVLRATTACTFSTSQLLKVLRG